MSQSDLALARSGFQPYRPDERLAHPAGTFPLDAYSGFPGMPGINPAAVFGPYPELYLDPRLFRPGPHSMYPGMGTHPYPPHMYGMMPSPMALGAFDRRFEVAEEAARVRQRHEDEVAREKEREMREREREQREKEQRERERREKEQREKEQREKEQREREAQQQREQLREKEQREAQQQQQQQEAARILSSHHYQTMYGHPSMRGMSHNLLGQLFPPGLGLRPGQLSMPSLPPSPYGHPSAGGGQQQQQQRQSPHSAAAAAAMNLNLGLGLSHPGVASLNLSHHHHAMAGGSLNLTHPSLAMTHPGLMAHGLSLNAGGGNGAQASPSSAAAALHLAQQSLNLVVPSNGGQGQQPMAAHQATGAHSSSGGGVNSSPGGGEGRGGGGLSASNVLSSRIPGLMPPQSSNTPAGAAPPRSSSSRMELGRTSAPPAAQMASVINLTSSGGGGPKEESRPSSVGNNRGMAAMDHGMGMMSAVQDLSRSEPRGGSNSGNGNSNNNSGHEAGHPLGGVSAVIVSAHSHNQQQQSQGLELVKRSGNEIPQKSGNSNGWPEGAMQNGGAREGSAPMEPVNSEQRKDAIVDESSRVQEQNSKQVVTSGNGTNGGPGDDKLRISRETSSDSVGPEQQQTTNAKLETEPAESPPGGVIATGQEKSGPDAVSSDGGVGVADTGKRTKEVREGSSDGTGKDGAAGADVDMKDVVIQGGKREISNNNNIGEVDSMKGVKRSKVEKDEKDPLIEEGTNGGSDSMHAVDNEKTAKDEVSLLTSAEVEEKAGKEISSSPQDVIKEGGVTTTADQVKDQMAPGSPTAKKAVVEVGMTIDSKETANNTTTTTTTTQLPATTSASTAGTETITAAER